jgi:F0F1-type ATP synthase assembly protein I
MEWASRVTTIGLEFALPPLVGYGVDYWLRTTPAATIAGAVLGFATGMLHTLRMTRQFPGQSQRQAGRSRDARRPRGPSGDTDVT